MTEKYYIDACIWRDYFENRSDRFRPLGDWAFAAIQQMITNGEPILYSDLVEEELSAAYSEMRLKIFFPLFQKKF